MNKRIVSFLLILTIICTMFMKEINLVYATSKTADNAISWVQSKVGQAIDVDGYYGAQCVDLIMAYYQYLGVSRASGDGKDYATNSLPVGWSRIKGAIPQKGDVLVYTTGEYGHVAIYESDSITYHQNFGGQYVRKISGKYNSVRNGYWGVIRPNFTPSGNNPVGCIDSVTDAVNAVHVRGWAFDEDDSSKSIQVHVYIGGPAGSSNAEGYSILADKSRSDVNRVYGISGNHGYESTINTNKVGSQPVYIYAINTGSGTNTLIGQKTVTITNDTEPPTISDVQISKVTSTGYTISCKVKDNKGVTRVRFPSWHESKTGDDAKWLEGTIKDDKASCRINTVKLGNKVGKYYTHIYAYDKAGNRKCDISTAVYIEAKTISESNPVDIGKEFVAYISNGDSDKVLTVDEATGNVISKTDTNSLFQRWKFIRNNDGSYQIISQGNKKLLDVFGGYETSKSNVQVYEDNNTDAQKWFIYQSDSGNYWLRPKCSENCVLDLEGGILDEGTNIQIHEFNATDAQKFRIIDEKQINEREKLDIGDDFYATIENIGTEKVLTVNTLNLNVECRTQEQGLLQYWRFEKNEDGSYTITSQQKDKCLEVASAKAEKGSNVQVYEKNDTNAQKWDIYEAGGNAYYFKPQCSDECVMDLFSYSTEEGANIGIYTFNSTTAQRYFINKCEHKYNSGVINKKATCIEEGIKVYTCDECGATKEEYLPIIEHEYSQWSITENATCIMDGIQSRTCQQCAKTETKIITKLEHKYEIEVAEPTCTNNGSKIYTCTACGDNYAEDIKATGHKYKDTVIEATEDEKGYTLHECEICGYSYKSDYTKPMGHNYVLTESQEAKCTVDGYELYKCNDCDDSYSVTILAMGHSYSEKIVKPTCTEKGYTVHMCSECGEKYKDSYVDEVGHNYSDKIMSKATCTTDGLMTYECSECEEKKTSLIPATGHNYEEILVDSTCESGGYILHKCKNCNISYKDNYVEQLEHNHIKIEAKQPTCISTGINEYVCEHCGDSYSEIIPMVQHNYAYELEREATCISQGLVKYACSGCGDTYSIVELSKAHNYVETIIKPTETQRGYSLYTCTECGYSYTNNYVEVETNSTETITTNTSDKTTENKDEIVNENKIKVKKTRIKSIKRMRKSLKVRWKKIKGVKGYQINFSTSKKFKKAKNITIIKSYITSRTIKKLKSKKKYYLRIRTYRVVNGKRCYSAWSKARKTKTK